MVYFNLLAVLGLLLDIVGVRIIYINEVKGRTNLDNEMYTDGELPLLNKKLASTDNIRKTNNKMAWQLIFWGFVAQLAANVLPYFFISK